MTSNHYLPDTHREAAYTATAGSVTVGDQTYAVRVLVTTDAHVKFGGDATTSDMLVKANQAEVFSCKPGSSISARQVSTGGDLHVTELTQ